MADFPSDCKCSECPLSQHKRRKYIPTAFGLSGKITIIGEQPGKTEASEGVPFVGASGQLLDHLLKKQRVERRDCTVLNAIGCYVEGWQVSDVSEQQAEAAWRACRPRLLREIAQARPRAMLALGSTALQSLFEQPLWKVTKFRGALLDWGGGGIKYEGKGIPTTVSMHPAAILRGTGHEAEVLADDIAKVVKWSVVGPDPVANVYTLDPTPEELEVAATGWKRQGWVCIDIEGIGVNRWACSLRLIGLGDTERCFCVPWGESKLSQAQQARNLEILLRVWLDPSIEKIGHNFVLFDQPVLERFLGHRMAGRAHDTMLAHHSFNMIGLRHGLQYVSTRYLDVEAWKTAFDSDFHAPLPQLAEYNSGDVISTARLWLELAARLTERNAWAPYMHDLDSAAVALELSRNGMCVDQTILQEMEQSYRDEAQAALSDVVLASEVDRFHTPLVRGWLSSDFERWTGAKLDLIKSVGPPPVAPLLEAVNVTKNITLLSADRKKLEASARDMETLIASPPNWEIVNRPKPKVRSSLTNWSPAGPEEQVSDVDLAEWKDGRAKVTTACQKVKTAATALKNATFRDPFFEVESDQQVGRVIHEWLGLVAKYPRTKTGDYQTNEDALAHLRGHPFVAGLQKWKGNAYRLGRCEQLRVACNYPDRRPHPLYKVHIIPSGRYSCGDSKSGDPRDNGNFQNLDKELLRCFVVPEGWRLVGADYSAAEIRVNAVLSGCLRLLQQMRDFDAGRAPKVYVQVATDLWPEYPTLEKDVQEKLYKLAKMSVLMSSYGGGPGALFSQLRSSLHVENLEPDEIEDLEAHLKHDCEETQQKLRTVWPEVFRFATTNYYQAMNYGWMQTCYLTGRRVRFPIRDRHHISPTDCANLPIQTTTRAVVAQAEAKVMRRLPPDCLMVADTHDFLMIECPEGKAELVAQIMREEMPYYLDGPAGGLNLPADPSIGRSWVEVK